MKLKKEKKKSSLLTLFENDANFLQESIETLYLAINTLLNEEYEELGEYINKIIQIEKNQDKNRELIISKLFSRETLAFSRADKQKIINDTNEIVGEVERVARRAGLFRPKILDDLKNSIINILNNLKPIANELRLLIINVFYDFKKAKENSKTINDLRRELRNFEYESLGKLYNSKGYNTVEFIFLEDIIINLAKIANRAERFADDMSALITKYSL